ncbi:hypothetical protein GIS00_18210 [Nakamurella sp. YIM 132087]|uniref:Uncharacterized protein n=1 Tax=Nakamurella alba TaxID=2665158 RepID=A0A7K1FNZ0_9ACTN|nr:hypothetical protein [Nakamurella alba]MTD15872.1 hypothetical protein [Nakamurella alba]
MHTTHIWSTRSSHLTSDGLVRYQQCACGRQRVLLDAFDGGAPSAELARPARVPVAR